MRIHIPKHFERFEVISQLKELLTEYAKGGITNDGENSFESYFYQNSLDPVKKFLMLCIPKDKIGEAGLSKQVITGEYVDGYENGTMNLTGVAKSGASVKYTYKVENGVAVKSSNEDSQIKGQYIIAKSSDGKSNLTSDGSKRGVEGFLE